MEPWRKLSRKSPVRWVPNCWGRRSSSFICLVAEATIRSVLSRKFIHKVRHRAATVRERFSMTLKGFRSLTVAARCVAARCVGDYISGNYPR